MRLHKEEDARARRLRVVSRRLVGNATDKESEGMCGVHSRYVTVDHDLEGIKFEEGAKSD